MSIPSQGEFQKILLQGALNPGGPAFKELRGKEGASGLDESSIRIAVAATEEVKAREIDLLRSSFIYQWLEKQPGFLKARDNNKKHSRKAEIAARKARMPTTVADWLVDWYFREQAKGQGLRYLENHYFSQRLNELWIYRLIFALNEYYYSETASRMYSLVRRSPKILGELETMMTELIALGDGIIRRTTVDGFARVVETSIPRMREAIQASPFKRDSKHNREQLLVYRLWQANVASFRTPQPEVISELLTVEGVAHQFDLRTVGRLCAKFREAKSSRKS